MTAYVEESTKREQRLFHFLDGLDLGYESLRSHILLMNPLHNVDTFVSMTQQEESQNEVLGKEKDENVGTTLYSKNEYNKNESKPFCTVCKKRIGIMWLRNVGIELKNVLYVPEFKQNLLSVQKLNEHDNCCVLFHKDYCVM